LRVAPLVLALALLLGAVADPVRRARPGPGRPNIILVLTDDQDVDSLDAMPRVRRLLTSQGVSFSNSFVSVSLCCPSRASLLTGRYAHNHGVRSNKPPLGGFTGFVAGGHEASGLATWLHAAGYRTALVGKYLNGYPAADERGHVPPGWDEWQALFSERGSDNYFDYSINANGRIVAHGHQAQDYATDVLAEAALAILRKPSFREPFFLLLAPSAPHASSTPAPRHEGLFVGLEMPRGPSFDEEDVSDKPAYVRDEPRIGAREREQIERRYRRRRRTLVAVDEMLERVLAALQADGRLERSFVFYTSDNGWFDGEHRFARGKAAPYDESIRVPLIVRGPGVPPGVARDQLVVNVDLAATLVEIAAARPPGALEGRSLLPLLGVHPPAAWRRELPLEYWSVDPEEGVPGFAGLRSERQLYVEYETGERELYDTVADPFQLRNVFATADADLRRRLATRLADLRGCRGAACRD
jgi:N-acetylglucosamine-6-sulfatase